MRLSEKRNSNSHDARPFHQIITMIKWIRTSKLSIKKSLSGLVRLRTIFAAEPIDADQLPKSVPDYESGIKSPFSDPLF